MKNYLIPIMIAIFLIFGCSGEGYVKVVNNTASQILVSVNNEADVVVTAGDTTDTYTISVPKGIVTNVSVEASGDWVGNYSGTAAVTDGETVIHRIEPLIANLTIRNGSVDSAMCSIENYEPLYFEGDDSLTGAFSVDATVDVEYGGRYMFAVQETKSWFPGNAYRYVLEPNACEIQLNNLHPNRTIYYVYLSKSTDPDWGTDDLGDDLISPMQGYIWKAEGDVMWDIRLEAGDVHPDSALYIYEFYDVTGCPSDVTCIYEFPTIFTPVATAKIAKADAGKASYKKSISLNKVYDINATPARLEKVKKVDVRQVNVNALKK